MITLEGIQRQVVGIQIMSAYWTRFASTGDPNGPGVPKWPAYDGAQGPRLEIGHVVKPGPVSPANNYNVLDEALRARLEELQQ